MAFFQLILPRFPTIFPLFQKALEKVRWEIPWIFSSNMVAKGPRGLDARNQWKTNWESPCLFSQLFFPFSPLPPRCWCQWEGPGDGCSPPASHPAGPTVLLHPQSSQHHSWGGQKWWGSRHLVSPHLILPRKHHSTHFWFRHLVSKPLKKNKMFYYILSFVGLSYSGGLAYICISHLSVMILILIIEWGCDLSSCGLMVKVMDDSLTDDQSWDSHLWVIIL